MPPEEFGLVAKIAPDVGDADDVREQIEREVTGEPLELDVEIPEKKLREAQRLSTGERARRTASRAKKRAKAGTKRAAGRGGRAAKGAGKFGAHFAASKALSELGLPVNVPSTSLPGLPDIGKPRGSGPIVPEEGSPGGSATTGTSAMEPDEVVPLLQSQLEVQETMLEVLEDIEENTAGGSGGGDGDTNVRRRVNNKFGGGSGGAAAALAAGGLAAGGLGLAAIKGFGSGSGMPEASEGEQGNQQQGANINPSDVIATGATVTASAVIGAPAALAANHVIGSTAGIGAGDVIGTKAGLGAGDVVSDLADIDVGDVVSGAVELDTGDVVTGAIALGSLTVGNYVTGTITAASILDAVMDSQTSGEGQTSSSGSSQSGNRWFNDEELAEGSDRGVTDPNSEPTRGFVGTQSYYGQGDYSEAEPPSWMQPSGEQVAGTGTAAAIFSAFRMIGSGAGQAGSAIGGTATMIPAILMRRLAQTGVIDSPSDQIAENRGQGGNTNDTQQQQVTTDVTFNQEFKVDESERYTTQDEVDRKVDNALSEFERELNRGNTGSRYA